jgi:hypothetical protein
MEETMTKNRNWENFLQRIRRGREFEKNERSHWRPRGDEELSFEAPSHHKGKRGRIDIRLFDLEEGFTVVVELKATDWDRMAPHRVRPNALRHTRQIWRYIEAELENADVLPALVYPAVPETPGRKGGVESILHERFIQVVWRGDGDSREE